MSAPDSPASTGDVISCAEALDAARTLAAASPSGLTAWNEASQRMNALRARFDANAVPAPSADEIADFKALYAAFRARFEPAHAALVDERTRETAERDVLVAELEALATAEGAVTARILQGRALFDRLTAMGDHPGRGPAMKRARDAWKVLSTLPLVTADPNDRRIKLKLASIAGVREAIAATPSADTIAAVRDLAAIWPGIGPSGPLDRSLDMVFAEECRRFDALAAGRGRGA